MCALSILYMYSYKKKSLEKYKHKTINKINLVELKQVGTSDFSFMFLLLHYSSLHLDFLQIHVTFVTEKQSTFNKSCPRS